LKALSVQPVIPHVPDPDPSSHPHGGWTILAHVLRPQGRKGEVLAELLTDFPERFKTRKRVFLALQGFVGLPEEALTAEVVSFWLPLGKNQGRIVLHFSGIDSINQAETLAGMDVLIPEVERLQLEEDASYVSDLIGCTLYDLNAEAALDGPLRVGIVTDVQFATTPDGGRRLAEAAPLLAVETQGGEEVLVPYVKAFLVALDLASRRIEMSLPEGLLDVNRP